MDMSIIMQSSPTERSSLHSTYTLIPPSLAPTTPEMTPPTTTAINPITGNMHIFLSPN
ncbi:hypothetical protein GcM1_239075 [Golovinomyces cichoracearum]|uniref:Uncharacterized protein n=1 Tax=Golovinomyces cichoracearum TaxID=62708 RepID=A0A420IIX9_9PEZI|nr:hypothetical protein GcM1_239075 [Golovinomyces cichoracearum]